MHGSEWSVRLMHVCTLYVHDSNCIASKGTVTFHELASHMSYMYITNGTRKFLLDCQLDRAFFPKLHVPDPFTPGG